MAKKSNIDKFLALSDVEKAADVGRAVHAKSRPLTSSERKKWEQVQARLRATRAAKGRGRPVTGRGAKVISLSMEQGLLARADARARKEGISRAALVARGLETILAE